MKLRSIGPCALGVLAAISLSATVAHATPIEYQFTTGTLSGTFFFDLTTGLESDVSITVSGDSATQRDGTYSQIGPSTPPATTPGFGTVTNDIIVGTDAAGDQAYIGFSSPLTASGGTIDIRGVWLVGVVNSLENGNFSDLAEPVQQAAPEPRSLALLSVGVFALVTGRRRSRK